MAPILPQGLIYACISATIQTVVPSYNIGQKPNSLSAKIVKNSHLDNLVKPNSLFMVKIFINKIVSFFHLTVILLIGVYPDL
ncbi:MAG: hypothetical protein H6Q13_1262 [Bacteroidetes bacterium]|nr:hypothetical protein [Bacteroidota bacterium]